MNKKLKIILIILLILVVSLVIYGLYYVNDYYHAEDNISSYLNGSDNVSIVKTSNGLLLNGSGEDKAIIFYPGAKIEYTSYLPLLMNLSNEGIDCFIVEMPYNLAFFGKNSANDLIINDSYNYDSWYISGHSLGGVIASSYVHDHEDDVKGLILLAAYPTDVINVPVLSIYGNNDNVLDMESYDNSKSKMHNNFREYVIDGGNHAQYAFYGNQNNDGLASINRDNQIRQTVNEIVLFVNS